MMDDQMDDFERLRWLGWAVTRAPLWAMTDRQLLESIAGLLDRERPDREYLLRELERRLPAWPGATHRSLATVLSRLSRRHAEHGRQAQRVDQLLVRLVHQVRGRAAHKLAHECLSSPRLMRRRSAWRYFHTHGIDAKEAETLGGGAPEPDLMYVRLVAPSSEALQAVGVERALSVIDSFYWRARALESALAFDTDAVRRAADRHPAEVLFALHRSNRGDQVDLIRDLLRRHRHDVEIVAGAIRALATSRATNELSAALEIGRGILSQRNASWLVDS